MKARASSEPAKKLNMRAVARRAGVSIATVSRVLGGHPAISEATRRKTLRAIQALGYRPDNVKRRFFRVYRGGNRTVAFVTNTDTYAALQKGTHFYLRLLMAVQRELGLHRYHLLIESVPREKNGDDKAIRCVAEGRVDAVILSNFEPDPGPAARLAADLPVVAINQQTEIPRADTVIPNVGRAIGRQLDYLAGLGHRRIACFKSYPSEAWQDHEAWQAYEDGCGKLGLQLPAEYRAPIRFAYGEHAAAIAEFLDRVLACGAPPTAILTYDYYAADLGRKLQQRGLNVPRDISLIGYDDFPWTGACPVPLTTFRQNFESMGQTGVRFLLERLREPDLPSRLVLVEGDLIVRQSSGPAPGAAGPGPYGLTAKNIGTEGRLGNAPVPA